MTFPESSNSQLLEIMNTLEAELLWSVYLLTCTPWGLLRTQTRPSVTGPRRRKHRLSTPEHAWTAARRRGTARAGAVRDCCGARVYRSSGMPGRRLVAASRLPARHGMPALLARVAAPGRAVSEGPVYGGCAPEPRCLLRPRDPAALREPKGAQHTPRCRYARPAGPRGLCPACPCPAVLTLLGLARLALPLVPRPPLQGLDCGFLFIETRSPCVTQAGRQLTAVLSHPSE